MEGIKTWWNEASSRDQLSLVSLGVCAVLFILFQFVYTPVVEMREAQELRVDSQLSAYGRVKSLAAEWKAHESAAKSSGRKTASVEKTVESSFAKHGLRVSGFDASGRSGIRVRFESANYEKFVSWLHDMEVTQGLKMKDVSIASTPTAGLISVSVLIQKN